MPKPDCDSPPSPPGICLNCGTHLRGHWCHECGQREFDFRQSFRHMVIETLEHLVHLDGRFSRSVVSLMFNPGSLTEAFLSGKRAAQVPPLRFYLFVSLLFFLTLPLRTDIHLPTIDQSALAKELNQTDSETAVIAEIENPVLRDFVTGFQYGVASDERENEEEEDLSEEGRRKQRKLDDLIDRFSHPQDFVDFIFKHAPNVILSLIHI